jgi:hypothetical protein
VFRRNNKKLERVNGKTVYVVDRRDPQEPSKGYTERASLMPCLRKCTEDPSRRLGLRNKSCGSQIFENS